MTFEDLNLNKPLLNALADLDYLDPTPIQRASFSKVMSGKDIVGIAQTGTGKTFAYLLPLLRMWQFTKGMHPSIAILVPTRELVVQVEEEIKKLTTYMAVRTVGVYGGVNMTAQAKAIYAGTDVIVATPARLMDLALNGHLKLSQVSRLVIDEVDEMLNLGFRVQLKNVFDLMPPKRQNIMFSATLTEEVSNVIDEFFNFPERIEVAPSGTPIAQIRLAFYDVLNFNTKLNLLSHLLSNDESMTKVLVFAESKKLADKIYERLNEDFPNSVAVIHSNKSQNVRFAAVNGFDDGAFRILVATDIIARGLDIKEVSHVFNFDTPAIPEDFIHRVGRTGRADKEGIAITFVTHQEVDNLAAIEYLMGKNIDQIDFPSEVTVSNTLIEEEKETFFMKNYLKPHSMTTRGAFHTKKDKNMKKNLGGFAKKRAVVTKKLGKKYKNTR